MLSERTKWLAPLVVGGVILLGACSDDPVQPDPTPVAAEVQLSPEAVTLTEIGATEALTATVLDEDGQEMPDAPVSWSSSDEEVAVVDEDGVVEAVGEGTATITAESGDASASVDVTVELEEEEEEEPETD